MLLEQGSAALRSRPDVSTRLVTAAPKYLPALDGWRSIAILMVLCAHGFRTDQFLFFDPGARGVMVFMIISGYLITTRLLTTYTEGNGIAFLRFYVRRACRILPPVTLYLAVLAVLSAFARGIRVARPEIIASLFFWRNYLLVPQSGTLSGWYTGHFWSLAVEEHFYLLWPLAIHLAGRKRSLYMALAGAAACAFWRWFGWEHGNLISFSHALDGLPYFFRTDKCVDALLIGCVVALSLRRPEWESAARRYLPPGTAIILVYFLGLMCLRSRWFSGLREELAVAVLLVITLVHPDKGLARILSWRPLRAVGALSYSLYIWQQLFFPPEDAGWWTRFPASLLLLFTAAAVSYCLIEKPSIAFGARITAALGTAGD
jgi:peptidoglycan/LPS O-acetylase OafA/YrhL